MVPISKLLSVGLLRRSDESESDFSSRLLSHSESNEMNLYYKRISAIQNKAIRKSQHKIARELSRIYGKDIRKVKRGLRKSI